MKQTVHKEEIPTAKVYLKSYSASLAIRKMKDKTVLGFCRTLVLVRMSPEHPPPTKKEQITVKDVEKRGPLDTAGGNFYSHYRSQYGGFT